MKERILITGDTGNVGRACATLAENRNFTVVRASRSGGNRIDLSMWNTTMKFIEDQKSFDLVIVAHGTQKGVMLKDASYGDWHQLSANNLESYVALTSALLKYNKIRWGGLIVYCSSIQATNPREGRGLYAIAKAGVEALTKIAAVEFAPKRVRAVALRLGQMTTPMKGISFNKILAQEIKERCLSSWPTPTEVAKLCFHLYDQPSITGTIIDVSSGHLLNIWP